jgi:hypothetical protein
LDRQRADRAALRDQLSQMRQDLDRASRDQAALGGPAGDAIRPAGQGPAAQRSTDTEREQRGQRVTGEAGRIGSAASLPERQQRPERMASEPDRREQVRLQDRLDQLGERAKGRVDPHQLDAFRQGQLDQLRERQDASRQLRDAVQAAAAQLDQQQRQRQQVTADAQQDRPRDLAGRRDQQRAGLVDLVNQVLSQLSGARDQQNACLRRQHQDALAAAAPGAGGDLSRVLDRQRADRDALRDQLSQIRQDLDRASRDLAAVQLEQQQRQRQQVTADGQQGRPRDLGERRDQQRAGLGDLVNQVDYPTARPAGHHATRQADHAESELRFFGKADESGVGVLFVRDWSSLTRPEQAQVRLWLSEADQLYGAGLTGPRQAVSTEQRKAADQFARAGHRFLESTHASAAGHVPDVAGGADPITSLVDLPKTVNSSIGGQWKRYEPGFRFTGISAYDESSGNWIYLSGALEQQPRPAPAGRPVRGVSDQQASAQLRDHKALSGNRKNE